MIEMGIEMVSHVGYNFIFDSITRLVWVNMRERVPEPWDAVQIAGGFVVCIETVRSALHHRSFQSIDCLY